MTTTVQTTNDPIARLGIGALVAGYVVLALAVPAQASPSSPATSAAGFVPRISAQAAPTPPLPTVAQPEPTAPAPLQEQAAPDQAAPQQPAGGEAPAPAPEQPGSPAAVVAQPVDEARPAEHKLTPKDRGAGPVPPEAVQPENGAVLLQANDAASFQNVLEGEGSKPARKRP